MNNNKSNNSPKKLINLVECDKYNKLQEKIEQNIIKITDQLQLNNINDINRPKKDKSKERMINDDWTKRPITNAGKTKSKIIKFNNFELL